MLRMKRIISIVLCAALLCIVPLCSVQAAEPTSGACGEHLTWSYDTGTRTLTISGTGGMDSYHVDFYDGFYVTTAPWRTYYDTMQAVVIENGITSIGDDAFFDCTGLTSIMIPDSVTSIGWAAFDGCTGLTSVTIPDSVTSISSYAFDGCTGLTSITIPDSVTSVGHSAFDSCTGLVSVMIGNSVESINDDTFASCTGLESITIPDSVTSIGRWAFYGCTGLKSITIPGSVACIGRSAFNLCTGLKRINIDSFSAWCRISFDDSGANPLAYAHHLYMNDSEMTTAVISTDVSAIGSYQFYGWSALKGITIPDSVTSIDYWAFEHCTGLTEITIPASVMSIDGGAFYGCTGLTSITVDSGNTTYHSEGNCLIETETKTLIAGCKTSVIPKDGSVTSIGNSAFYKCTGLTSIMIPDSVTSIGAGAFADCTGLTSITIPDSVKCIDWFAFENCTSLKDVYFQGTREEWAAIEMEQYNDPLLNAAIHFLGVEVAIRHFVPVRSEAYKTTITFTADATNLPEGAAIHWFVNGKDVGVGETYTVKQATADYTVQCKVIKDGRVLAESAIETVKIKTGFFAKIVAFFRGLFGRLPVIEQAFKEH